MENNNNILPSPKKSIQILSIIHLVLSLGIIFFGTIVYLQVSETNFDISKTDDTFFYLVPILAIGGIWVSNFLFNQKINEIPKNTTLIEKLAAYQTASIIKYALLEGPAFLGIIAFMEDGNLLYLLISGLLVLYLFYQKPTKDKIEIDLNLSEEQKYQLNK
ncbi:MAG: hypothetical protein ABFR32_10155 [Bacteroidota bacterium]